MFFTVLKHQFKYLKKSNNYNLSSSVSCRLTPIYTNKKYYNFTLKMQKYTEIQTLKISKTQKQTLNKMKDNKVCISKFIRNAIKEKIQREYSELIVQPKKVILPF